MKELSQTHKTVQSHILKYAQECGWTLMPCEAAEQRRGFNPNVPAHAKNRSLFFPNLLNAKVREFNPRYAESAGTLLGRFRLLHTDIHGNREFVEHLATGASSSTLMTSARGATMPNLNSSVMQRLLVHYPDPKTQTAIIKTFATIDQKLSTAVRRQTMLQDLFRTLLHELMTAKIRMQFETHG